MKQIIRENKVPLLCLQVLERLYGFGSIKEKGTIEEVGTIEIYKFIQTITFHGIVNYHVFIYYLHEQIVQL